MSSDGELESRIDSNLKRVFDEFGLSRFSRIAVQRFLQKTATDDDTKRARSWFVDLLNQRRRAPERLGQKGCPEIVPGLRATPFWDTAELPWVEAIEANVDAIRKELMGLRTGKAIARKPEDSSSTVAAATADSAAAAAAAAAAATAAPKTQTVRRTGPSAEGATTNFFQPYRAPSWTAKGDADQRKRMLADDGLGAVGHDTGNWNVCYLRLHNMDDLFEDNRERCPKTIELTSPAGLAVNGAPPTGAIAYNHSFFSAMAPGTHITPHNGPTNKKLRCHLPLIVPPPVRDEKTGELKHWCRIRVDDEIRPFEEGKCLVFDDSFTHEVWNDHPTAPRVVLIFDIWHPDLHRKEVNLMRLMQRAKLRLHKHLCDFVRGGDGGGDNETGTGDGDGKSANSDEADAEAKGGDDFFDILHRARDIEVADADVFG